MKLKDLLEHTDDQISLLKQIKISEKTGQNTIPPALCQYRIFSCYMNEINFFLYSNKLREYNVGDWIVESKYFEAYTEIYATWFPQHFKNTYTPIPAAVVESYWPGVSCQNEAEWFDNKAWLGNSVDQQIDQQLRPWIIYMCKPNLEQMIKAAALRQAKKINWPFLDT